MLNTWFLIWKTIEIKQEKVSESEEQEEGRKGDRERGDQKGSEKTLGIEC